MDADREINATEVTRELHIQGHVLTICAFYEDGSGWLLSIQNEKGVMTNWVEYFSTAEDAINTGLKTINEEGLEEFMACDDFGYLYDGDNRLI